MAFDEDDDLYGEEFDFVDEDDAGEEDSAVEAEETPKPKKRPAPRGKAAPKPAKRPKSSPTAGRRETPEPEPAPAHNLADEFAPEEAPFEEPAAESAPPVPAGPPADHVVHIYEHGDFSRTIDRKFTDEEAVSFAEEYTRTGKAYGRYAVATPDDEEPAPTFAGAAKQ